MTADLGLTVRWAVVIVLLLLVGNASGDPSLVAHYTFDEGPGETVRDSSKHGNHGRNRGARYVKGPAGAGYVLRFEDPDAYVDCGDDPSLDLTEPMTIELWPSSPPAPPPDAGGRGSDPAG